MAIDAVSVSGLMPYQGPPAPASPSQAGGAQATGAFPTMLNQLVHNAAQGHESANAAVRDLALGQTDNLHGVMLQMAQADLMFHLALEIRNRLTEAYQEIMKMQM